MEQFEADLVVENEQLKRELRFIRRHVRRLETALSDLFKQYCEESKDHDLA